MFKMSEAELQLLAKTRAIIISGEVNSALAEKVMAQLLYLQELSADPIKIFINSQGGHVESGDTIHDFLSFVKPRVIIIGTGWVASAGVLIYLGVKKEDRYALPNTRFMIHQPSGGTQGQVSDIEIEAHEILKMKKRLNTIISKKTGQPLATVTKDAERNHWMSAEEAQEYGIVSKIVSNYTEL